MNLIYSKQKRPKGGKTKIKKTPLENIQNRIRKRVSLRSLKIIFSLASYKILDFFLDSCNKQKF